MLTRVPVLLIVLALCACTQRGAEDVYGGCPARTAAVPGPGGDRASDAIYSDKNVVDANVGITQADWTALMAVRSKCGGLHRCEDVDPGVIEPCCKEKEREVYVPVTFTFDNDVNTLQEAELRLKGNPRDWKPDKKPQFIIRFSVQHKSPPGFRGVHRLNLEANPADRTLIRNNVAMLLMRESGIVAPRTNHLRLSINGQLFGVYENIESVDSEFIKHHFGDPNGNLYKHGFTENLKSALPEPDITDLDDLEDIFERSDEFLFEGLDCLADVNGWLRLLAAEAVLPATDNFWSSGSNFYFYSRPAGGFSVIPWDLDDVIYSSAEWDTDLFTLKNRRHDPNDRPEASRYWRTMQNNLTWRNRFLQYVTDILDGSYAQLDARIDTVCCNMRQHIVAAGASKHPFREQSSIIDLWRFEDACAELIARVRCRRSFLNATLKFGDAEDLTCATDNDQIPASARLSCADEPVAIDGDAVLGDFVINELSASTGRIEIVNRGNKAASLTGWTLTKLPPDGTPRTGELLQAGILQPGERVCLTELEHGVSLPGTGTVHLVTPAGDAHDTVSWCDGAAEPSWCRFPDGTGDFQVCPEATFCDANVGVSNDARVLPTYELLVVDADNPLYQFEPEHLAFASDGRLWAAEPDQNRVHVWDLGDTRFTVPVAEPQAVAADANGLMYVVDGAHQHVKVFSAAACTAADCAPVAELTCDSPDWDDPRGLAVTSAGQLFVAQHDTGRIFRIAGGACTAVGDADTATFVDAETLTLDEGRGLLFVGTRVPPRVDVFDLNGASILGAVGELQSGASPEPGRFASRLSDVGVDAAAGILFLNDEKNDRVMLHDLKQPGALVSADSDFAFLAAFGRGAGSCATLDSPRGVAVSRDGAWVAVADEGNERVLVFATGEVYQATGVQ